MAVATTVADALRHHAAATPDAPAAILGERTITFGELDDRSSRVAQALQAAGVGAGDRVAILDKNSLEYFDLVFGAAKLNAVLVAVNWRLAPPEAAFIVDDAQAKVLVVGEDLVPLLEGFEEELQHDPRILVIGDHARFVQTDVTSESSAHRRGKPMRSSSTRPLSLSEIHSAAVLLLKPYFCSRRNVSHHSNGSAGIESSTPAIRMKSARVHVASGAPQSTTRS